MAMPKNLFLVRHGESEGNLVRDQFRKTKDKSFFSDEFLNIHESQYRLTELGKTQAQKAGEWFAKNKFTAFDRMLVSNNVRAMQTASFLNLPNANWMMGFNLRERDGGLFNVVTPSKRDSHYADQQKFYDTQPFLFRPPQGESVADVCQRIKIILDTLSRRCDGKNVIIVCHGHVMRAFRIILERMSLERSNILLRNHEEWAKVPNCSIFHYTREYREKNTEELSDRFEWMRIIRPAGGDQPEDAFSKIVRKKYSNEELLAEAQKNRTEPTPQEKTGPAFI